MATLDVLQQEPPTPDHPLLRHEAVRVSPHTAASSNDAMARLIALLQANLARYLADEPLENRLPGPGPA